MSARRSWPAPGWTWSAELETYVPDTLLISARLEIEARRLEARELEELREDDRRRSARSLKTPPGPWNLTP